MPSTRGWRADIHTVAHIEVLTTEFDQTDAVPFADPEAATISRRDLIKGAVAGGAALMLGCHGEPLPARRASMKITCVIRYQIDPFQREAFKEYAANWARIIPRCGGELVGYFLPYEGTNDIGWGLIAFGSLAAYETYKTRLRGDADAQANFATAASKRFILREERNFVEVVDGTFGVPAHAL